MAFQFSPFHFHNYSKQIFGVCMFTVYFLCVCLLLHSSFIDNHVVIRKLFIFIVVVSLVAHNFIRNVHYWLFADFICPITYLYLHARMFNNWFTFAMDHFMSIRLDQCKTHHTCNGTGLLNLKNYLHHLLAESMLIQSSWLNRWWHSFKRMRYHNPDGWKCEERGNN